MVGHTDKIMPQLRLECILQMRKGRRKVNFGTWNCPVQYGHVRLSSGLEDGDLRDESWGKVGSPRMESMIHSARSRLNFPAYLKNLLCIIHGFSLQLELNRSGKIYSKVRGNKWIMNSRNNSPLVHSMYSDVYY